MKRINLYFFGEEEISRHDFLWFYGSYAFWVLIAVITFLLSL